MTRFDIIMGENKEKKEMNKITLILEENDDILKSIEAGLKEHQIKSAQIKSITGFMQSGLINDKTIGKTEVNDIELISANGKFKFGGDDMWGSMSVFTGSKKPLSGQLLKGYAKEGLEINLEY